MHTGTQLHQWSEFQLSMRHSRLFREVRGRADRCAKVNGLHCTFKRSPLLWLSPFRVLHYPCAVLRDYSAMTNECPILCGSHPRPPCPLSAITPRSRATHIPDSSNILLIFIFRKTNWRRIRRINNGKKIDVRCQGRYSMAYMTRKTKPLFQLSVINALLSFEADNYNRILLSHVMSGGDINIFHPRLWNSSYIVRYLLFN